MDGCTKPGSVCKNLEGVCRSGGFSKYGWKSIFGNKLGKYYYMRADLGKMDFIMQKLN